MDTEMDLANNIQTGQDKTQELIFKLMTEYLGKYLEAKQKAEAAYREQMAIKGQRPEIPDTITCQEDYDYYLNLLNAWLGKTKLAEETHEAARQEALSNYNMLKKIVPIPNVWFKVQAGEAIYAVGKYWTTWGGGHYEMRVEPWEEKAEKLEDRTYFP